MAISPRTKSIGLVVGFAAAAGLKRWLVTDDASCKENMRS